MPETNQFSHPPLANAFHVAKSTKATISKMANAVNIEVPESASSTTDNCGPTDSKSMYFKDKQYRGFRDV